MNLPSWLLLVSGVAVLFGILHDLIWTTLVSSAGGGWLTGRVGAGLWGTAVRLWWPDGHRRLRLVGVVIVILMLMTWTLGVAAGWGLVLQAAPDAVVDATTREPASALQRFYFALTTIATLGPGDYVPGADVWRIVSGLAALSGLTVATLAITYFVPVIGAVTERRTLAFTIAAMGRDPVEIAQRIARAPDAYAQQLLALVPRIAKLSEQHLAYPVLHDFHDVNARSCGPVQIAALDEALTLLRFGVEPDARPPDAVLDPVREAIRGLLRTLADRTLQPADHAPPAPRLAELEGLALIEAADFAQHVRDLDERRRMLLSFVCDDGWGWDSVCDRSEDPGVDKVGRR